MSVQSRLIPNPASSPKSKSSFRALRPPLAAEADGRILLQCTLVDNGTKLPIQNARYLVAIGGAGSSGRRNTGTKSLGWGLEAQSLAWSFIELPSHPVELRLRVDREVGSLGKILPQQPIGVLIGSTLPRALRIAKVDVDFGRQRKPPMIGKLLAPVPGQRPIQRVRYRLGLVVQPGQQIAFPMTRHGAVFNRCRPLADRHQICDLPPVVASPSRSAHRPL